MYLGPVVESVFLAGAAVVIHYAGGTEGGGLKLRSGYGFEVCAANCGDGFAANLLNGSATGFAPASVASSTSNTVTITPPTSLGGKPVLTVRYVVSFTRSAYQSSAVFL